MSQGTGDWHRARAGMITASRFGDVIGKGKNGQYLKAREDYLIEIVTERLTGEPIMRSHGVNGEYGKTLEEYARLAFEAETGIMVRESDFIQHPELKSVGCSPDGLISDDSGLEIKCPASSVIHLRTILTDEVPAEHMPQIQGNLWVTNRSLWHFVSYDGRMPAHLRLFHKIVPRDDKYIETLDAEIRTFERDVQAFMAKLPRAA